VKEEGKIGIYTVVSSISKAQMHKTRSQRDMCNLLNMCTSMQLNNRIMLMTWIKVDCRQPKNCDKTKQTTLIQSLVIYYKHISTNLSPQCHSDSKSSWSLVSETPTPVTQKQSNILSMRWRKKSIVLCISWLDERIVPHNWWFSTSKECIK
jgi:hypothetical protein